MTQKILVPIAEGFEEIEAVTIIDVMRRADLEVTVAGLGTSSPILGSRGIRVQPDVALEDLDPTGFDVIVLPGGLGCTEAFMGDEGVLASLRTHHGAGKLTAAICAAPMVLAKAGLIDGVPVTSHPAVRGNLGNAEVCDSPRVIQSGNVMTSQGAGTAMEFALALVEELCGADKASELATAMVVPEAVPSA
jgi:4-methyl-5(b-hydroxyethyl)-thiazole monophosphate biosynthesis